MPFRIILKARVVNPKLLFRALLESARSKSSWHLRCWWRRIKGGKEGRFVSPNGSKAVTVETFRSNSSWNASKWYVQWSGQARIRVVSNWQKGKLDNEQHGSRCAFTNSCCCYRCVLNAPRSRTVRWAWGSRAESGSDSSSSSLSSGGSRDPDSALGRGPITHSHVSIPSVLVWSEDNAVHSNNRVVR